MCVRGIFALTIFVHLTGSIKIENVGFCARVQSLFVCKWNDDTNK